MRKKRGAKVDYEIYDRKLDETIDKCLTCTKAKCTGECQLIKKVTIRTIRFLLSRQAG